MGVLCVLLRIEQPVEVNDEVAHLGVVHGLLRFRLPGRIGGRVVRVDSDDLDFVQILEGVVLEIGQLAADHEVKQLRLGIV